MFRKIKRIFNRSSKEMSSLQEMQKILSNGGVLLDVRSNQEYEEGHLPSAICLPVYHLKTKIGEVVPNKQTTIVVYCSSGSRSKQAKMQLEQMGYQKVYNLNGGLNSIS